MAKGRKRNVMADMIRKGGTQEQIKNDAFKSNRMEDIIISMDLPSAQHQTYYRRADSSENYMNQTRNDTQTFSTTRKCST